MLKTIEMLKNIIIENRVRWTKELVQKESEKYNSRGEFQKNSQNAYEAARRNGWLDDITSHMVIKRNNTWTYNDIFNIAQNYNKLIDFKNNENAAFLFAKRHKFLDDIISHMKRNIIWTIDKLEKESLKYKSRSEFEKNVPSAYNAALRMGIIDDITKHMKLLGNRFKRMVYTYEFSDKHFYVGLTYNQNRRNNSHFNDVNSSVYQHMLKTGLKPELKVITDYISNDDAIKKENETLKQYADKGWVPLNKKKTGNLGGNLQKWSKEEVINIAGKYTKLKDFRNNEPRAWYAATRNGWYDDVVKDLEKTVKVKKYTQEILKDIINKYQTLSDFRNQESSAYNAVLKYKWKHLLDNLNRKNK